MIFSPASHKLSTVKYRKKALFYAVSWGVLIGFSTPTNAANIFDIARDFVKRVDRIYVEKIEFLPIDQIPEGGTLLLKPRSHKIFYVDDIYATKKNGTLYLALEDVINILEFSIDYDPNTQKADGWFMREDWQFNADFQKNKVISKNVTYDIKEADITRLDGLLFVEGQTLAKWLGLEFNYDIKDQVLNIESSFPLPSIARNLRQNRHSSEKFSSNEPLLPRLETEKSYFDINTADINLGTRYRKSETDQTETLNSANVILEGELLKHNAYFFGSGDSDDDLTNIVSRISKRSEDPTLLGPLKARSYSLGDIDIVNLPLAGSTGQDLGFRFDNNKLDNTDFAATDIEGDSIPGWDIELYRNDVLINNQAVDTNGRYRFEDIRLFVGDNNFELFFFGPQGEIRSENISVPVNQQLLASQNDTYEISISFEDTQTLQSEKVSQEDDNAPHIAARYNRLIGEDNLGFVGFRSNQIGGDRKFYLTGGLSSTLGESLLDTNFAVDESGELAAEAILRRRIANWDTSFSARANTDNFITGEAEDPTVLDLGFNAQKSFHPFGLKSNILANGNYQQTAAGSELGDYNIGLSHNISGTSISNRLSYENNDVANGTSSEQLDHIFSVRKNWNKYFFRFGTTYGFTPETEFRNVIGQVNYRHNNQFSGDLAYEKQLSVDLDTTRLNLNYNHDQFRLSPFFQIDSDDEIISGVNLNFSLSDDANSLLPDLDNRRLISRGALSALVFHDKDGNLLYDGNDEPLPNTIVESVNYKRRAKTDEEGYASIKDLATTQATDIIVDRDTLPDPFMIPAVAGNSIFPDAGSLYKMQFPVHLTGEVEGYVYETNDEGERKGAGFQTLRLTSLDNPERDVINAKTERDGYYVIFDIPPGDYLLTTENKRNKFGNDIAQIVSIGFDGTIVKDRDLELSKTKPYVPYQVSFNDELGSLPIIKTEPSGISKLAQTLNRLIQGRYNDDPYEGMTKISAKSDDKETYYKLSNPSYESAHEKCQTLLSRNIKCSVIIANR